MDQLSYEFIQLCKRNREGSLTTQKDRQRQLSLVSRELKELGFKNMSANSLKPKHVTQLLQKWQDQNLSAGTIKNRMSVIRWWAEKINKPNIIPKDNQSLGIPQRQYLPQQNRAKEITEQQLQQVADPYLRVSFELQQAFGLRREECLKFQPSYADKGDRIELKGSWTKGGRPRTIPILNQQQRDILQQAHRLVGGGSLTPPHKNYIQQRHAYDNQCKQLQISNLHGLRHMYAQDRYHRLTGWLSPIAGGKKQHELTPQQYQIDQWARQIISNELGHSRIEITVKYLGK